MFNQGESYLVVEDNFDKVFSEFNSLVSPTKKGFIVWRVHPSKEAKYLNGKVIKRRWITNINTVEDHLTPHDIEQLSYDIEHFMKENRGGAVLLMCIEYLISFNSFSDILHLIQAIKDFASEYECVLIVHVGVGTLDKQQEKLLGQELTVVGEIHE